MRELTRALIILSLVLVTPQLAVASGGSSGGSSPSIPAGPEMTPEQKALEFYAQGLKHRDKAWKLEEGSVDNPKREKMLAKAAKEWTRAARAFREAIENNPYLFQAHGSLGYAYRKQGNFEDSLGAYNRALELEPRYVEAIEYRAEAYLGLNRVEEAKEAYMELFRLDRGQADTLMSAMESWIEAQREGGSMSAEDLDAFSAWVEERSEIASQTALLIEAQTRDWGTR